MFSKSSSFNNVEWILFHVHESIWQMCAASTDIFWQFYFITGSESKCSWTLDQRDEVKMLEITIKKQQPNETVEIELSVELCIKRSKYIYWRRCSHQLSEIMKNIEYTVDVVEIVRNLLICSKLVNDLFSIVDV